MPFNHNHIDSYEFGIKAALEANTMSHFKADDRIENRDIMCKICEEIQKAEYLIFNISDLNPNVMLELGLSYGLGKETILVKHKDSNNISDLSNTEYIEYAHAVDLRDKLLKYFE
jgi:nucleoside 2-deoxyribosyltransferase